MDVEEWVVEDNGEAMAEEVADGAVNGPVKTPVDKDNNGVRAMVVSGEVTENGERRKPFSSTTQKMSRSVSQVKSCLLRLRSRME